MMFGRTYFLTAMCLALVPATVSAQERPDPMVVAQQVEACGDRDIISARWARDNTLAVRCSRNGGLFAGGAATGAAAAGTGAAAAGTGAAVAGAAVAGGLAAAAIPVVVGAGALAAVASGSSTSDTQ
ncbi:MAG: hypothetical protein HRU30_00920 [Rhodobacteraceae bacterium]|nr:hypothetical protein [Paracoccaceae bacterium]